MNVKKRDLKLIQNLNCFKFNSKQKKDYEKWLKEFVKPLSEKELDEMEKEKKEKIKTFEDFFPVTRFYVNKMDYNPLLGAWMIPNTILLAILIATATILKEYLDLQKDD